MTSILSIRPRKQSQPLTHLMKQGDLVLVKGSHAVGLNTVVNAITAEPVATEKRSCRSEPREEFRRN